MTRELYGNNLILEFAIKLRCASYDAEARISPFQNKIIKQKVMLEQ
jgi:hypothetical protein